MQKLSWPAVPTSVINKFVIANVRWRVDAEFDLHRRHDEHAGARAPGIHRWDTHRKVRSCYFWFICWDRWRIFVRWRYDRLLSPAVYSTAEPIRDIYSPSRFAVWTTSDEGLSSLVTKPRAEETVDQSYRKY